MMNSSIDNLLVRYQRTPSDEAFRDLVSRHAGLVHATATRLLNGDQSAADDVSQQVFLRLLRKAPTLPPRICMAGWLYRQTCRIASDSRRATQRRKARELTAITNMTNQDSREFAEGVDEALACLPEQDRSIILLRYFDEQTHRAVGESLGISEDAARKRCARALETMREIFKGKGQAFSSATLGILLSGLATKPLSAEAVAKMLPQTISSASPLFSFVVGLAFAGLSASSFIWLAGSTKQDPGISEAPPQLSDRRLRTDQKISSQEFNFQSIDLVLEQIRLLTRSPRHAITLMELDALFDSIPVDQRHRFFRGAKDKLSIAEKRFSYAGFLKRWMEEAPEEAMNLCLTEDIESQLQNHSTHLVQNLFADWARQDLSESSIWLKQKWDEPALDAPGFPHSLKVAMSHDILKNILSTKGVEAAFEEAKSIGNLEDFPMVTEAITGTLWNQVRDDQGVDIYRHLIQLPDTTQREELVEKFILNWKLFSSGPVIAALDQLEPAERLPLELFLLGEYVSETRQQVYADGSLMTESLGPPPTEEDRANRRSEREEQFRETAHLAGLNEEQANLLMAKHYLKNEREDASLILKELPPSPELDRDILEAIRRTDQIPLRGSAKQELKAFRYAQYLSSSGERNRVSRALFRRIIVKNPHHARSLLTSSDLMPEMRQILQEVALRSSL